MQEEGLVFALKRVLGAFLVMGCCLLVQTEAFAQGEAAGMDQHLLSWVNGSNGAFSNAALGLIDHTAYPVFFGAIPAAWVGPALTGADSEIAAKLTLSLVGAAGLATGLKLLVKRDRPNATLPWVRSRPQYPGGANLDPHSWPSGHSAMAAALATSLALSYRSPYVVAPAVVWAGAVGVSRVWLGVHYPSDVVSGWALGVAVTIAVHAISNNQRSDSFQGGPLLNFVIPL